MGIAIHFGYSKPTLALMETIGQRIKARRIQLGMSRQADLGALVGLDQSTISDIENGARFRVQYVMPFARALRWSPEQLLEGKAGPVVYMTDEVRKLVDVCTNLGAEDMATLIRIAEAMRNAPKSNPGTSKGKRAA